MLSPPVSSFSGWLVFLFCFFFVLLSSFLFPSHAFLVDPVSCSFPPYLLLGSLFFCGSLFSLCVLLLLSLFSVVCYFSLLFVVCSAVPWRRFSFLLVLLPCSSLSFSFSLSYVLLSYPFICFPWLFCFLSTCSFLFLSPVFYSGLFFLLGRLPVVSGRCFFIYSIIVLILLPVLSAVFLSSFLPLSCILLLLVFARHFFFFRV